MAQSAPVVTPPDPLSQLRDIHVPGPIEWWPPAPGWFILAALGALLIAAAGVWLYRRWRRNRYRREALEELARLRRQFNMEGDAGQYLLAYAALLKRTALTRYPRGEVANLTGEAWVNFLDRAANTDEFSMGAGQVLIQGNYLPEAEKDIDVLRLHDLARHWIKRHGKLRPLEHAA